MTPYLHLSKDPVMAKMIKRFGPQKLHHEDRDLFTSLVRSIIGQQLSTKAASTIYNRFVSLLKNPDPMNPYEILNLDTETVRQKAGVSYSKIKYIKALSQVTVDGNVDFNAISEKSDEVIIAELTNVKGIGIWTAEMFLIGALGREDVFSVRDLGLRNAVALYYKVDKSDHFKIESIAKQWSPYRSYACIYLWMSLDNKPQ